MQGRVNSLWLGPCVTLTALCTLFTISAAAAQTSAPAALAPSPAIKTASAASATSVSSTAPSWKKLSPAQQSALAPIAADWDAMDAQRKKKWLAVAQRYTTLPAPDQQRMHERMQAWSSLTPAQRQAARDNYTQALSSPASAPESGQSKANLNAQWAKYQALPPEKRAALQAAAEQASKPAATDKSRPIPPKDSAAKP